MVAPSADLAGPTATQSPAGTDDVAAPKIRRNSRGAVLNIIRADGPLSRVEIAAKAGLTPASVSLIVRDLLGEGLVVETGQSGPTGGKRRTLLEVAPRARFGVGIHLAADWIVYVATDMAGGLVGRQRRPASLSISGEQLVSRINTQLLEFLETVGVQISDVVGIGLVAAGPIDFEAGTLVGNSSLRPLTGFALRSALEQETGLRVVVEKDATAAAIGEAWGASSISAETILAVYMGTGIGGGVVTAGKPFRGSASNAGEIGHISLDPAGTSCFCGNRGCLELYAAPAAVVAEFDGDVSSDVNATARRFDEIARASSHGDVRARESIQRSADSLASGVLIAANLFDPDKVVLTGPGFAVAGTTYVAAVKQTLDERFFAREVHDIAVELGPNPRDAAAAGASALSLQVALSGPSSLNGGF